MRRAIRNGVLLGSIWGAVPAFLFANAPESGRDVIICLCAGMMGGGVLVLGSAPAAAIGMIVPLVIGSIVGLAHVPGREAALLILLVLSYALVLIDGSTRQAIDLVTRLLSKFDLERLSCRDSLTGLPNVAGLREAIKQAITRGARSSKAFSVFQIDIHRLRDVNHRSGYAVGDELLRQVAARLRAASRDVDLVVRLDSDQFAVLALGLGGEATVRAYANRLLASFRQPFDLAGVEHAVEANLGAAVAREAGSRPDDILRNAALALSIAESLGPGQSHFYTVADEISRQTRDALERDLRDALTAGKLSLNYQPFLDIRTGGVVGFEALLRWNHPVRGFVPPPEIVGLAEERGLIDALGAYVLGEACAAAATWPAHLRVAVNVSPLQLRSRSLVAMVESALRKSGIAADRLEIEVTESALIEDQALARHLLTSLRDVGVSLALDDFGVGFSSLNYLRHPPFDRLKIDRAFIAESVQNADAGAIVRAILGLARDLRLRVTAEGIETGEQLAFLRENHCGEAQGYLIGKPMAADAVAAYLDRPARDLAA
jgi:diguanylate cyclase (GGDEF)-like protein